MSDVLQHSCVAIRNTGGDRYHEATGIGRDVQRANIAIEACKHVDLVLCRHARTHNDSVAGR